MPGRSLLHALKHHAPPVPLIGTPRLANQPGSRQNPQARKRRAEHYWLRPLCLFANNRKWATTSISRCVAARLRDFGTRITVSAVNDDLWGIPIRRKLLRYSVWKSKTDSSTSCMILKKNRVLRPIAICRLYKMHRR